MGPPGWKGGAWQQGVWHGTEGVAKGMVPPLAFLQDVLEPTRALRAGCLSGATLCLPDECPKSNMDFGGLGVSGARHGRKPVHNAMLCMSNSPAGGEAYTPMLEVATGLLRGELQGAAGLGPGSALRAAPGNE